MANVLIKINYANWDIMKFKIKRLLRTNDIIPNIVSTYPKDALKAKSEECFYSCLKENNCNIICYHISRLTEYEIQHILNNGLTMGTKQLFRTKINNLPNCCNWFKNELLYHIDNLRYTQAENAICASYGFLDLEEDLACDNIFHTNWGGETIYNHYDHGDRFYDEHCKKIHSTLQKISYPCLIIVRVTAKSFCSCLNSLYEKIKSEDINKISGAIEITDVLPEIVEIIDLDKYSGIDFN